MRSKPTLDEIDTIYVEPKERFVVSLIVSYATSDLKETSVRDTHNPPSTWHKPRSAREFALSAAAAALDLTQDMGSTDTVWFVYDRHTKQMHQFEQREFEDFEKGW